MKHFWLLLLCFSLPLYATQQNKPAVITSPVADLLGQPYKHAKRDLTIDDYYHDIPFSGNGGACWRLHQALFNEIVDVLEERDSEVKVRISNFFYIHHKDSSIQDTFWIAKKHLMLLDDPEAHTKYFPPPVSYKSKKIPNNKAHNVVTLKKPFYDSITKETYSVGTRFMALQGQSLFGSYDKGSFKVYIFDKKAHKVTQTRIPKRYCIRNYFSKPEDQIRNYVQVLRSWTQHKRGFIPYVLGGFSWTTNCTDDAYEVKTDPDSTDPYFHRTSWNQKHKVGFDCVGIIGRAAQICDIPFFFKNTLTLKKALSPLKKGELPQEGDLIYYPGHVMVISDLERNLIIEARGYDYSDYGRVQEVPLSKKFPEVKTFQELAELSHQKKAISISSTSGVFMMKSKSYKILKMQSVWGET